MHLHLTRIYQERVDEACETALHKNISVVCAHARSNAIIPYPKPLGSDGQLPLLSANADGIHATDDREGPKVLDSAFVNLGAHLLGFAQSAWGHALHAPFILPKLDIPMPLSVMDK